MKTINIPEDLDFDDLIWDLYIAAKHARQAGHNALAGRRMQDRDAIRALNTGETLPELTEVGAVCHCEQRDADEIAVYLKADELLAVEWMMNRVTFGDLDEDVDPLHLHRAMQETAAVITNRLSDASLR